MLQIIGWLMCGYLVVKAFELFGHARNGTESARTLYYVGGGLSLLLAPLFLVMLNGQASSSAMPSMSGMLGGSADTAYSDNLAAEAAADTSAAIAATEDLGAAADNALREAEETMAETIPE